jgi:hypothetical protein
MPVTDNEKLDQLRKKLVEEYNYQNKTNRNTRFFWNRELGVAFNWAVQEYNNDNVEEDLINNLENRQALVKRAKAHIEQEASNLSAGKGRTKKVGRCIQ